jgi:nicotinamidase-related amidase
MQDALLVVDVLNDFRHPGGDRLLASFRERLPGLVAALEEAREDGVPVLYVNDSYGDWSGDRAGLIARAALSELAPRADEPLVFKPRYSAFDHTPVELILRGLGVERILLAGGSTEGCIVQTGIDARELGFKVTILASACATVDEEKEHIALRYAESVAGIFLAEIYA